jgi:hypothetical protein
LAWGEICLKGMQKESCFPQSPSQPPGSRERKGTVTRYAFRRHTPVTYSLQADPPPNRPFSMNSSMDYPIKGVSIAMVQSLIYSADSWEHFIHKPGHCSGAALQVSTAVKCTRLGTRQDLAEGPLASV